MELPKGYIKGVPRVSNIVSYVYPFGGEGQKRYLEWVYKMLKHKVIYDGDVDSEKVAETIKAFPDLAGPNIGHMLQCEAEYLKEAQDVGTFVHEQMEVYLLSGEKGDISNPLYIKHKEVIKHGYNYIDQLKRKYNKESGRELIAEPVLRDEYNRFQGSSDLVLINESARKIIIKDYKTFGIAKARYNLPNTYRKPYDKLKKGALQFSLYAETYRQKGYDIESIDLIYLHETGAFEYQLDLYSSEEINKILERYIQRDELLPPNITLLFKYNPMRIEINTVIPNEAYSNARIVMEDQDLTSGKTMEENIDEIIRLQKYLVSKY